MELGEITQHNVGKTLDKSRNTGEIREYITTSNLYWGRFEFSELRKMPIEENELAKCTAIMGDLLICEGGDAGRSAIWNSEHPICFQNHIHRIRPYAGISANYLYYYMLHIYLNGDIKQYLKGVGIQSLSGNALASIQLPLPSINEQYRIVAEIERLFSLVDTVEENKLFLEQFITQTKSKVLDLAIQGKLVPQNPDDEPASVLLERIRNEQKFKKTSSDKFQNKQLPKGWIIVHLGDIFKITMGQSPDGESVSSNQEGVEFHQGKIHFTDKYLSKSDLYTTKPTKIIEKSSVLLCVRAPVGVVNISKNTICIGRGLCAATPIGGISTDFVYYWMKTLEKTFIEKSTGSTFQSISMDTIKKSTIPLPPLTEQLRIVEKIEEIFKMLDKMQANLQANT